MLILIDYGFGNLRSVYNKLKRLDCTVKVSEHYDDIKSADKLILPGVGNFATGINKLKERNQYDLIRQRALEEKIPILGICLGMQLFSMFSEEGESEGLKLINAKIIRFRITEDQQYKLKVPHMGWNNVKINGNSVLLKNIPEDSLFYFVHSYHYIADNPDFITGTTIYGYEFISLVEQENIFGTQFHPEKSQDAGMQLLKNFVSL